MRMTSRAASHRPAADPQWDTRNDHVTSRTIRTSVRRARYGARVERNPFQRKSAANSHRPFAAQRGRTRQQQHARKRSRRKSRQEKVTRAILAAKPRLPLTPSTEISNLPDMCARMKVSSALRNDAGRVRDKLGTRYDAPRRNSREVRRVEPMAHAQFNFVYDRQGGPRGGEKAFVGAWSWRWRNDRLATGHSGCARCSHRTPSWPGGYRLLASVRRPMAGHT